MDGKTAKQSARSTLKRLGLYEPVVAVLSTVDRTVKLARFSLADDTRTVQIGDARAEFWMTSRNEFASLRSLPEEEMIADLLSRTRPDDVFYDVGANIGVYSCLAADVLETDVVAFEPEPSNADRLEENVELNDAAVDLYRYALSDANGTADFAVTLFGGENQTGPAGHSLVSSGSPESDTITVETVVGDEFVADRGLPSPTVVKIDVEGAEMSVLRGLEETLSRPSCRLVYCELHRDRLRAQGYSAEDAVDHLEGMGYTVEIPFERDGEPFVRAERPEGA